MSAPAQQPAGHRPRLAVPVLTRLDGELQVGCTPGTAQVIRGTSAPLASALRRLDGSRTISDIVRGTGVEPDELNQVVEALSSAGLLEAPSSSGRRPTATTVRLLGAGTTGRRFAEKFVPTAAAALCLIDPEPPVEGLYDHPEATGAESLRTQLRLTTAVPHGMLRIGEHWSQPGPAAALTVVALDRLECDRAITDTLLRTDQPHLFLRPAERGVVVGPLVLPGLTACTRCMDLYRCSDPQWPRVLNQLCRTRVQVRPALLDWGTATALQQVLAFLSGHQPEALGSTIELEPDTWLPRVRRWPNHPGCGCQLLQ